MVEKQNADSPEPSTRRDWPSLGYICTAVLSASALVGALRFALEVRAVLVVVLFGVLFGLVLVFPVDFLSRVMPRWLATLVTFCLVTGLGVAAFVVTAPFVGAQVGWLLDHVPTALERAQDAWRSLVPPHARMKSLEAPLGREAARLLGHALPVAFGVLSTLSSALAVLALALFLAYDGRFTKAALVRLVPKQYEQVASDFLVRVGNSLQRWMLGQLMSMTVTGMLTALGLLLIGVESWLVLGLLSFVFEFVPYVGAVLAAVPGIITGFAVSTETAVHVGVVYAVVQLIESYALQPLIMKRAIRIRPALQLVWQLLMGAGFGVLGIFVATPLLTCVQVAVQHFYIERRLGKPASVSTF